MRHRREGEEVYKIKSRKKEERIVFLFSSSLETEKKELVKKALRTKKPSHFRGWVVNQCFLMYLVVIGNIKKEGSCRILLWRFGGFCAMESVLWLCHGVY